MWLKRPRLQVGASSAEVPAKERPHRLLTDVVIHHELTNLGARALNLGLVFRILVFAMLP